MCFTCKRRSERPEIILSRRRNWFSVEFRASICGTWNMKTRILWTFHVFHSLFHRSQFQLASSGSAIRTFDGKQVRKLCLVRRKLLHWSDQFLCNFFSPVFSVVRLTDRKYMLDLQKRIQEDYHDTLMKRISQRQVIELHLNSLPHNSSVFAQFSPKKLNENLESC